MSSGWQEAAAQQAEEVSARLRQLLTTGLGLLRTELGLELGLQPQKYPSWVFLAVPIVLLGLFFLLLLLCAAGRGSPRKKRAAQSEREPAEPLTQSKAPVPSKAARVEEAKKKDKKKQPPAKAKPNGRPVKLSEEEQTQTATVKKESPKQAADTEKKNEKLKKNKKKVKSDAKPTTQSPSQDKKESEEGNWETKISNKEKRQLRKRDKDSDVIISETSTSLGDGFTLVSSHSTNVRKSKGPSEVPAVNGSGWNEKPAKAISSQPVEEKWVPPTTSAGKKKAEPVTWGQGAVDTNGKVWTATWSERSIFPGIGAWPTVESRINSSERGPQAFSPIGLSSAVSAASSDPLPPASASDSQWEATPPEPSVDDEWSGLNGITSTDVASDWKAPAEEWGNFDDEEPEPAPQLEEAEQEVPKASDDEKERDDNAAQGSVSSKPKKKKKKKKKQGDESGSPTQEPEGTKDAVDDYKEDSVPAPLPPVTHKVFGKSNELKAEPPLHTVPIGSSGSMMHNVSEKKPSQVQQPKEASTPVTKQNNVPPPSQAKSEESWESPKQVKKKKKARRET